MRIREGTSLHEPYLGASELSYSLLEVATGCPEGKKTIVCFILPVALNFDPESPNKRPEDRLPPLPATRHR